MKKTTIWTVVLILIVLGLVYFNNQPKEQSENIKVGAILPMTGASASFGEQISGGMKIAQEELKEKGIDIEIIIEDSEGLAPKGISAYNKLVDVDKVDVVVSVFTRVSVAILPLAKEDKIPVIMTIVAGEGVTKDNPYAIRFYSTATQYANPSFDLLSKEKYPNVSLIYINDEYGQVVAKKVRENTESKGINLIAEEAFLPNSSDFRTQLANIKSKNPQALLAITVNGIELGNIIRQAKELNLNIDFFEQSASLSMSETMLAVGELANGAYTGAYPFDLNNEIGKELKERYQEMFSKKANFAASMGYDIVKMIARVSDGKSISTDDFMKKMRSIKELDTLNGVIPVIDGKEINPPTVLGRVVDGRVEGVK